MPLGDLATAQVTRVDGTETLFGRAEQQRVFISSEMASGALAAERAAAADEVNKHPDFMAWKWEGSVSAGRYPSLEECIGNAQTSDLLILILGDDLTEVTKAEWQAARGNGANCAVLVKRSTKRNARANAFIAEQRTDGIDVDFSTIEELRAGVAAVLRRNNTVASRQMQLARRARDSGRAPGIAHLLEAGIERVADLVDEGSIREAAQALDGVETLLGPAERPGSLDVVAGLVHGHSGRTRSAIADYQRVITSPMSEAIDVAVAHQNLGLELMRAGHTKDAAKQMRIAYRCHVAIDNWFGVLQVTLNLANLLIDKGELESALELLDLADGLREAFVGQLPHQKASALATRAHIAALQGRHQEALDGYKRVLAITRRCDDHDGEAIATQNIGSAYHDLGKTTFAERWATKALELMGDDGTAWRREEICRLLAIVEVERGNHAAALGHFERARAIAETMDDSWRIASLTADIGAVLAELGDDRAVGELDAAHAALAEFEDYDWLVRVDLNRAFLAERSGDVEGAVAALERAVCVRKASRTSRIAAHEALARTHLRAGRAGDAVRSYRKALSTAPKGTALGHTAGQYAHELQNARAHREALSLFDTALRRSGEDLGIRFSTRSDRALLLAATGRETEALVELRTALVDAKALRDKELQIRALHNIGELERRVGNPRVSVQVLKRAAAMAATFDPDAHRAARGVLAISQLAAGQASDAHDTASSLLSEAPACGDQAEKSVALGVLAGVAFEREDYEASARMYRAASRLNVDDPQHHHEDLCGIMEAHAAAGRWRPTVRAAQAAVDHAQANGFEANLWPSLLRAARWYLDRGAPRRAAILTFPAWGIAAQSSLRRPRSRRTAEPNLIADSRFLEAVMTTAFHVLWGGHEPADGLYEAVIAEFDLEDDTPLRIAISSARDAATAAYSRT